MQMRPHARGWVGPRGAGGPPGRAPVAQSAGARWRSRGGLRELPGQHRAVRGGCGAGANRGTPCRAEGTWSSRICRMCGIWCRFSFIRRGISRPLILSTSTLVVFDWPRHPHQRRLHHSIPENA
eukprot:8571745-Pyramimonas_sp.AAC.1